MYQNLNKFFRWGELGARETLETLLSLNDYVYGRKMFVDKKAININYANVPIAFDIEDSSFYAGDQKISTMYEWSFGYNGVVFIGREWKEFLELVKIINDHLHQKDTEGNIFRCIIYVQFLDHEFQFIRKMFKWQDVFCRKERSPIYALTGNIEFRDSYILSGTNLKAMGENLKNGDYKKMVGDLDYRKIRGTKTPLTDKEINYCRNDVLVLNEYISEKIEQEGNIGKIPLTATGYIRRFVRSKCNPSGKAHKKENDDYYNFIHSCNITDKEYVLLKHAFQGGYTHSNPIYSGETIDHVDSIDFTSSYPAMLLSNVFPMSSGVEVRPETQQDFDYIIRNYLSVFSITFRKIRQKHNAPDSIISESKCVTLENEIINNGRVYSADLLTTSLTNVDFENIKMFYDYDSFSIGVMYIYQKGVLPKGIIESVLELYKKKTELKGIEGAQGEYNRAKSLLNSIYGMMVTSPIRPYIQVSNDGNWDGEQFPDYEKAIDTYNRNKRRFLFFPWGVFCTAYARRALFTGIIEFGKIDYIYSDTDSIKCRNIEAHKSYIDHYNEMIESRIKATLNFYGIDEDQAAPENIKGQKKQLGVWDFETKGKTYSRFKTLGAKRYIYEQDGQIYVTIAGAPKKLAGDFVGSKKNPFDFFSDQMVIDKDHSGKLLHTYLDYEQKGTLTDYQGNKMEYHELSSVHLEPTEFSLRISDEYKDFLNGVMGNIYD